MGLKLVMLSWFIVCSTFLQPFYKQLPHSCSEDLCTDEKIEIVKGQGHISNTCIVFPNIFQIFSFNNLIKLFAIKLKYLKDIFFVIEKKDLTKINYL